MQALNPDQRYNYINVDFSGFVTLVEESYRNLTAVDERLTHQITFGTYLHVMTGNLWLRILDLAIQGATNLPFEFSHMLDVMGGATNQIPQEIHEYLRNLGSYTDGFGDQWRINIPSSERIV